MTSKDAPGTPSTEQPSTSEEQKPAAAGVDRVGRDHTGDVLRELDDVKRRVTTVERQTGIVGAADENVEDVEDENGSGAARRDFSCVDCELEMCERHVAAAPAPSKRAPKASASK